MKALLLTAAVFCAATAASAAAPADPRIKTRLYSAEEVVVVEGRAGVQATIAFDENERIENVAIGDAASWQVTPNKRADLLFVKPLGPRNRTNMTVVTDRRTYLFDLVANPAAPPVYVLRFTFPPEAAKPPRQLAALSAEEADAVAAPPKEVAAASPAAMNFAWRTKGDKRILPSRIYDDGQATYLAWPKDSAIPAILTLNDKGEEGAVNYAVRGDVLVIDGTPKTIVLRSGRDTATLENDGKAAAAPTTLAAAQTRPEGR